ncbi:hypothetical protein GCM10018771_51420 [Streptomyces cellulosae]|nr:hypothetical protein GCM10018771_51420 [Streptomyces cellulosae]
MRISRAVASMSASLSRPFPRRFLKVALRRSERVSNTAASVLGVGGGWAALQGIRLRKQIVPARVVRRAGTDPRCREEHSLTVFRTR